MTDAERIHTLTKSALAKQLRGDIPGALSDMLDAMSIAIVHVPGTTANREEIGLPPVGTPLN